MLSMSDNHLYEYAILRIVPKVEREEFVNVGVIVFCKKADFLEVRIQLNRDRINAFSHELDLDEVEKNLEAIRKVGHGECKESAIAQMEKPERFRWLTAVRSSSLQTSRPHVGLTKDLAQQLIELEKEYLS